MSHDHDRNILNVQIEQLHSFLDDWTQSGTLPPESANYLKNYFLNEELKDWDVSRPSPYFGFEIPNAPMKFFYVWLDAPIGYYAGLKNWCSKNKEIFNDFVKPNSDYEQVHFIGKDILYFHSLFWPAILKFSGYRVPSAIYVHGFLTINGLKMSKSKGNIIDIFLPEKELKKQVMAIQTDSTPIEDPKNFNSCNVYKIFKLIADNKSVNKMEKNYSKGGYGYGHAKKELLDKYRRCYKKSH